MKNKRILKVSLALLAFLGLLVSCKFTVESIKMPDTITAGSTIEINTRMSCFHVQSDETSRLIFGMLVPSDWKAAERTTITISTEGRPEGQQGKPEVVNATMSPVDPSSVDPNTGLPWASAFQSAYGSCGNYGLTEWVVFQSDEEYVVCWGENLTWYIDAKITMTVPETNTKFYFANAFCGTSGGFGSDDNGNKFSDALVKTFEVTGGTGKDDYTVPPLTSTTPLTFTYEDIFSVNFTSSVEGFDTALFGENNVYLNGKCVLKSGKTLEVTAKTDATLMKKTSDINYYKYIYPRDFFGIPANDGIAEIYVWFVDKTGAKVVDSDGVLYLLKETGTPLK